MPRRALRRRADPHARPRRRASPHRPRRASRRPGRARLELERGRRARLALGIAAGLGQTLGECRPAVREPLEARREPPGARGCALLLGGEAGELALGALAACSRRRRCLRERVAGRTRLLALARERRAAPSRGGRLGREQLQPRLGGLAADHLGALGGRRLQLERAQAPLDLALDVARALEVDADAAEPGTRPAPPALVLAEAGGLLDQRAALLGAREQHLVDTALRDHAVQVAADTRVRERLLHLEAPDGAATEQVLGGAIAVQAPHHRDLPVRQRDAPSELSSTSSTSQTPAAGRRIRAGEQHVGARGRTERAGGGRSHRPLQGVGDVRLARSVRADDHRDAREEPELDLLGERLEAAKPECAQVHRALIPRRRCGRAPRALQPARTPSSRVRCPCRRRRRRRVRRS